VTPDNKYGNITVNVVNTPNPVAVVVREGLATLRECQEYYSTKDGYNMLEIIAVRNYNEMVVNKAMENEKHY